MRPDPGSDTGRVCALESANYMRNQLLRDADWAGMAHSLEIRTPLVDVAMLTALAPAIPGIAPGDGKAALAASPTTPLPGEITNRAKTGFSVPTGDWMSTAGAAGSPGAPPRKGVVSRGWSQVVLGAHGPSELAFAA